jgi:predicted enzyme related to lactoylglutathione lyase
MKVFYDQIFTPEPDVQSLLGPEGNAPHRLVSLQQGDSTIGMLGLLDYMQPQLGIRPFVQKPGKPYPVIIVIFADDVKGIASRVRDAGGKIIGDLKEVEIPERGTMAAMTFVDPNGILVDVNQFPQRDPQQPGPVSPLRRVTMPIIRGKMEESVRFYQQVLGMKVFYDDMVVSMPGESMLGIPGRVKTRVVSLQQGDSRFGMVGLIDYLEPEMEIEPLVKRTGYPYEVLLVFIVDDMAGVLSQATALGSIVLARKQYQMPQRGKADGAMITGPGGVVIDLTQWL